jgi:hypothetical protein
MKSLAIKNTLIQGSKNILRRGMILLRNRTVPLWRLEGEGLAGPAVAVIAGMGQTVEILSRCLFPGEVRRTELGSFPAWRIESATDRLAADAELSIACAHRFYSGLVYQRNCLRIPDAVDLGLRVPENIEDLRASRHSLKQDIRLIRKHGLEMSVTHELADFEFFYNTIYLPYITGRHGELAVASNKAWLRERFRNGAVIWAVHQGERLSGVVIELGAGVLHFRALGALAGDPRVTKTGAVAALYLFAIQHARENGRSFIDFGSCKAYLNDGILQYKRKWGMELRPRLDNQWNTYLRWRAWNPTIAALLEDMAVIHQDGEKLRAVTALRLTEPAGQAEADRVRKALFMPGLDAMVIVNEAGWMEGVTPSSGILLRSGHPVAENLTI